MDGFLSGKWEFISCESFSFSRTQMEADACPGRTVCEYEGGRPCGNGGGAFNLFSFIEFFQTTVFGLLGCERIVHVLWPNVV